MLIWLVLIPLIAAALIGLCKAPARPTALLSASLTLALGIWALVSFDGCSSCWSRFEAKSWRHPGRVFQHGMGK